MRWLALLIVLVAAPAAAQPWRLPSDPRSAPPVATPAPAAAPLDTALILAGYVEDLEEELATLKVDLRVCEAERLVLQGERRSGFEEAISDPRLWFIAGAAMGMLLAD